MRRFALFFAVFLTAMASAAQTVPELFQKGKAQVKGEAWKDALATFKQVEADAAKPENEAYRKQLEGPLAFYRGVCQANLDLAEDARANFEMFLRGTPDATMDPAMYSKKAVAAFEQAKSAMAPPPDAGKGGGGPSIFNNYQEFKPPPNISEPPSPTWADGPVSWLMTADEKKSVVAVDERRRAGRIRRQVLGSPGTRTATAARTRSGRASSAAWRLPTPSSCRTRRSAAA